MEDTLRNFERDVWENCLNHVGALHSRRPWSKEKADYETNLIPVFLFLLFSVLPSNAAEKDKSDSAQPAAVQNDFSMGLAVGNPSVTLQRLFFCDSLLLSFCSFERRFVKRRRGSERCLY